jgi:hypothetical protein
MRRSWLSTAVMMVLAASALGCGDSNGDGSETSTQAKKQAVPASLGTVESGAEDTIDFARGRDRAAVVRTSRELREAAKGAAAADLRAAEVPQDRITALQDRARLVAALAPRADLLRVSLAANQVSALMPEFYARYADPVPPEVLKLDYLDREAQLRSLAGDQPSVRAAVLELSSTWAKLRTQVIDAGGENVAASFTRHVRAMQRLVRSSDPAALQKEAVAGLELVDQLEDAFRKQ